MSKRKEMTCEDCGHPISICNALASIMMAEERHGEDAMEKAGYLRRDLAAPKVKPLEWHFPEHHDTVEIASTIFGEYTVWEINGGGYLRRPNEECGWPVGGDINSAKAAAQADYSRRILSALEGE